MISLRHQRLFSALTVSLAASAAGCGGQVVFDPGESGGSNGTGASGPGAGGSSNTTSGVTTGATGGSANTTTGSGNQGGSSVVSSGSGQPTNCAAACTTIYLCGIEDNNCPNFSNITESEFVGQCIPTCEDNPALVSLVNGNDCENTIVTISSLNQEFAASCQGFDG